jgi:hypothetical protein
MIRILMYRAAMAGAIIIDAISTLREVAAHYAAEGIALNPRFEEIIQNKGGAF